MIAGHPTDEMLAASVSQRADQPTDDYVLEHIGDCPSCQLRLDKLVAADAVGEEICGALRRESESARSSGIMDAHSVDQAASIVDFAVSFLEPTDRSGAIGRLGEFEILSVIGHGGMGIVLKGFQEELNRPVAVKVMSPHLATMAVARKRFLREAQATAAIVHPNVMPILSVSESSSLPFLVMPFVACHSLQQRLDASGPMRVVDALRIAVQVVEGLAAAHAQGLVHRDVKPANILLERSVDRAMLTDFGLARAADDVSVTRSGVIAGTPAYMSPEQARGGSIDGRSDLFSIGSVLYAMLVGAPPFRAETSYGVLRKITDEQPQSLRMQNPDVPEWLDRLVLGLLSKEASARPQSASDLAETLQSCLAHVQQPTVHALPVCLRSRPRSPNMFRYVVISAVLLLLIAVPLFVVATFFLFIAVPAQQAAVPRPARPTTQVMPTQVPVLAGEPEVPQASIGEQLLGLHEEVDRLSSQVGQ